MSGWFATFWHVGRRFGDEHAPAECTLCRMPVISRFLGISISMHFVEHGVPHFHTAYGGHRARPMLDPLAHAARRLPPPAPTAPWLQLARGNLDWLHLSGLSSVVATSNEPEVSLPSGSLFSLVTASHPGPRPLSGTFNASHRISCSSLTLFFSARHEASSLKRSFHP